MYALILMTFAQSTDPELLRETALVSANRSLPEGHTLVSADLGYRPMRADLVADYGFTNREEIVGRVLGVPVFVDEFLQQEHLLDPALGTGLNASVPKGCSRMRLSLEPTVGIRAGDRLDIGDVNRQCLHVGNAIVLGIHTANGFTLERTSDELAIALEVIVPTPSVPGMMSASKPGGLTFLVRGLSDDRPAEGVPWCAIEG